MSLMTTTGEVGSGYSSFLNFFLVCLLDLDAIVWYSGLKSGIQDDDV
jgi:hypothetical protein